MKDRRKFLQQMAVAGISLPFSIKIPEHIDSYLPLKKETNPNWEEIKSNFLTNTNNYINLNSASSGVMPIPVLNKYSEFLQEINSFAPYHVNSGWEDSCKNHFHRLASLINSKGGDLAFVRNTTEAINIILWGIAWESNDEILKANWDYHLVNYTCEGINDKYSVSIRTISDNLQALSDDDIVQLYENNITVKTRMILVTWITHREGRILPVKRICEMAHSKGIEVVVDGAQTIGHIEIDIEDCGCDYFACSLHKWLNSPLGSGILFIKDKYISSHRPHMSFDPKLKNKKYKYDFLGARAFQNMMSLGAALDFLEITGIEKKEKRLKELSNYWRDELESEEGISIYTDPEKSCAIASLGIKSMRAKKIKNILFNDFGVLVKSTGYKSIPMIRISPNIFTSFKDLDRFIEGVKKINAAN